MFKNSDQTEAYLAAIISSSDDAIISKDLKGNITSWNHSAERIFGYTPDEVIGKHITMLIPPERLEEEEQILTTLKSGNRVDHFETIRRHKDGHHIPISLTVSPIRDRSGNIVGASKISRDISQRIEAERALQEMASKKDEFLATMSHELRTPMNAVIGLATLLQSSDLSDRDRKMVDILKVSADSLLDLINDLLDFAKLESGNIQLERVKFDLLEQIQKVISVTNVKAREKNVLLTVQFAKNLNRYYLGDPLRLSQIIMNLVSNAVKFTNEGKVDILINGIKNETSNTTELTISVSDTGIGISPEDQEKIFERFTQADATMSRRFGGSGLGLSITKALIEQMNGTITLKSHKNVGSTFTVTLQLENSEDLAAIDFKQQASYLTPTMKKHILLVDDYMPNIMVAGGMIEQLGYSYDTAENGISALKKFMTNRYDVILMDIQMHDLDGFQATQRIREIEKERGLPHTPIIAMTAHVRVQDKEKCLEIGMDNFIPKPFHPDELKDKLAFYIK